jgi:flagellar FliJ protein
VKLSSYEVEVLQKRLAEIAERRSATELRRTMLEAEGEAEVLRAHTDATAGWHLLRFMEALRNRKALADQDLARIAVEERGARDALAQAFEEQKKYEQIVEKARLLQRREAAKRESVVLDELGLRRAVAGR